MINSRVVRQFSKVISKVQTILGGGHFQSASDILAAHCIENVEYLNGAVLGDVELELDVVLQGASLVVLHRLDII